MIPYIINKKIEQNKKKWNHAKLSILVCNSSWYLVIKKYIEKYEKKIKKGSKLAMRENSEIIY